MLQSKKVGGWRLQNHEIPLNADPYMPKHGDSLMVTDSSELKVEDGKEFERQNRTIRRFRAKQFSYPLKG